MPASSATRATFTSSAAALASSVSASTAVMLANPRPSRMTTPGMPPSRTSRLEPTPRTVIATPVGFAAMNAARSSASADETLLPPGRRHGTR